MRVARRSQRTDGRYVVGVPIHAQPGPSPLGVRFHTGFRDINYGMAPLPAHGRLP